MLSSGSYGYPYLFEDCSIEDYKLDVCSKNRLQDLEDTERMRHR